MRKKRIRVLDLFAGAGGLSLGFELVRDRSGNQVFELHRAVEVDKYACETLRRHYGPKKVIEGDLTDKDVHKRIIRECKQRVSTIVGGIPCQSFSLIGPRSGYGRGVERFKEDRRDTLYKEFKNIVKQIMPNIVVIENVKGILSKRDGRGRKIIDKLISDFERLGYNFRNDKDGRKYMLLNGADYGVPQRRERVILIGIKRGWRDVRVPYINPTHFDPSSEMHEDFMKRGLMPYVTVYDAIGDLPEVSARVTFTDLSKSRAKKIKEKNEGVDNGKDRINLDDKRFLDHLRNIGLSGRAFFEFVRPNGYKYIDHHTARGQQFSDIELFRFMKQGETAKNFMERMPERAKKLIKYDMLSFKDKYRKQKAGEPSTTVFAHLEKDGNRFIHPTQARTYTPREAARIQSFPDDFIFEGPLSKKFKQIGNAVPPLMSYNIAKNVCERVIKW